MGYYLVMLKLISKVFTEHGIYISLAALGFLASIVTIFVNTNGTVSIKWIIFLIWIFLSVTLILIKGIIVSHGATTFADTTKFIKYIENKKVILLRVNWDLPLYSLVSVYLEEDGYEELQAICYVENKQDKGVVSLKITESNCDFKSVKKLKIKTTLPMTATNLLGGK